MSVDEVEPIEAEAAEENAVATRGTHLASTQTVTHEYLTQSGKVMRETVTTNQTVTAVMDFVYDESGKPFAMIGQLSAQPKTYYYVLNLQGDVVKLIDGSGAEAAAYTYYKPLVKNAAKSIAKKFTSATIRSFTIWCS